MGEILEFKDRKKGIKVAVSILAATFLVFLYFVIFFFSGQDGDTSGSFSHRVTQQIIEKVNEITGNGWNVQFRESLVAYWEHPVRKMAHFSEYAVLAILVSGIYLPWKKPSGKLYF